jgi:archaeal flagellar protein FlaJ
VKSTKYSRFCARVFSKLFERFDFSEKDKNRMLEKANIAMMYQEYFSMVIMNIIIGFISAFISSFIIYQLFSNSITALLMLMISSIVPVAIGVYYISLPSSKAKARGREIDLYMPYATNFINTMSVAGISPAEIFEALSQVTLYGELQKEAQKITTEIDMMGVDAITALKNAIKITPSQKFKEFIQGILSVIQSGSELGPYFERCVDEFMKDDLVQRKRGLESLAIMAESFVVTVIAFPLFLIIILSVMGLTSGGIQFEFFFIIAFMVLPMAYMGFYVMMSSGMGKQV